MGVASFSVSVSPEMLTALLAARATVSSLPPAGVAFTVNADAAGTEEVFSGSLNVSVSVTPSAATMWWSWPLLSVGGTWSASSLVTSWSAVNVAVSLPNGSTSLLAVPVVGLV